MTRNPDRSDKPGGRILRRRADFAPFDAKYLVLFDLLASHAPEGRLPAYRDFDPAEAPHLVDYLNLAEVLRGPGAGPGLGAGALRFRFALLGLKQTQAAGRDVTGRFIEDAVLPDYVARINGNMRTVVESRLPVYDRFPMPHPNRGFLDSERVYYPLAEDGETVDSILILNGYLELGTGLPMLNY